MTILFTNDYMRGTIKNLEHIDIQMVCYTDLEPLWDQLVRLYHYLGFKKKGKESAGTIRQYFGNTGKIDN